MTTMRKLIATGVAAGTLVAVPATVSATVPDDEIEVVDDDDDDSDKTGLWGLLGLLGLAGLAGLRRRTDDKYTPTTGRSVAADTTPRGSTGTKP